MIRREYTFQATNAVWCGDYKGWFRSGDGTRIDRLTIGDACNRYLMRCQIVERTGYEAHTDNGVPFSSVAPRGLSWLSMWFVRLGIGPERSPAPVGAH